MFPDGGDPFFVDLQPVYEQLGEPASSRPRPGELAEHRAEIAESGLFDPIAVHHFDWEVTYDTEQYLSLLDTFSGHIAMRSADREHLYTEITARLAERPDRRLRRHWGAVLHVARRRS